MPSKIRGRRGDEVVAGDVVFIGGAWQRVREVRAIPGAIRVWLVEDTHVRELRPDRYYPTRPRTSLA